MLLARFLNFICIHRRQRPAPTPVRTLVCFQRAGLRAVEIQNGPGGNLFLTDEERDRILKEVDSRMYSGEIIGELTGAQIENSVAFQLILIERAQAASSSPSPT